MTKNNYIDNPTFLKAVVQRKKDIIAAKKKKKPKPQLTNYLGQCLLLIAQNLAHMPRFANYTYREEMVSDGIENMLLYFDNFDLKYKNPLNYFSTIAYWAFVRRIQKEKKLLYAKYKLHEQIGVLSQMDGVSDQTLDRQFQMYDNIADFIKTYEEKADEKKNKIKSPKAKKAWTSSTWVPKVKQKKKKTVKPKKRKVRKPRKRKLRQC